MSVPNPGVLYPSDLLDIQARAEDLWANDPRMADYIANARAAQVLLEVQTAQFNMLQSPEKDREVQLAWLDQCDAKQIAAMHVILMVQLPQHLKPTDLQPAKVGFKVRIPTPHQPFWYAGLCCQANSEGMMKTLDEFWAVQVVSAIEANKGENTSTDQYTVTGDTTEIPPSAWTRNLFGYFELVKQLNKINGAFLLTGKNLFLQDWQVKMNQANGEGKGAANMINTLRTEFDLFQLIGCRCW